MERGTPRCPRHTTEHWRQDAQERGTSTDRGVDRPWRELRNAFLAANPWCVACAAEGRHMVPGQIVDHIRPHRGDESLRLSSMNLQTLCRSHHALKTKTEGPGFRAPRRW